LRFARYSIEDISHCQFIGARIFLFSAQQRSLPRRRIYSTIIPPDPRGRDAANGFF
jgi:hypothetical protein